jgi:hypothetical protein
MYESGTLVVRTRTHPAALLVTASLIVAGCASSPVAPAGQTLSPEAPSRGAVSFEEVRDPSARPPVAEAGKEYLRPRLEEGFTMPSYPDRALAAGAPPTDVVVRIVVATDGTVEKVTLSPLAGPSAGEWEDVFYDVVRDAVASWKYDPCQLRELGDGPDSDGDDAPDYRLVVASTPVSVYLDIRFRFEIVAGEGQVSMGGGDG